MFDSDKPVDGTTRRAILKAAGGALGVAAFGVPASAHNKFGGGTEGYLGDNVADAAERTELVGYHSAGDVGPASTAGQPENTHRGAMTELRVHDDLAFVSMFSARDDDAQRGLAIFDVSDFTRATSEGDLEHADLTLLSFVRNDNAAAACMDVKVSDDGNWAFVCKQPVAALYGESEEWEIDDDDHSTSPAAAALDAVDVSDPGNPEVTDTVALSRWVIGPHNSWHHQIGGEEYVFTAHGADGVSGSLNVFSFDRETGQLQQLDTWSWPGQEESLDETSTLQNYAHDVVVQDDPRFGVPIAYLSYLDAGTRILDVSDPTDIEELGVFEAQRAHHSVPAPTLIGGKRVFLVGHENPDGEPQSEGGYVLEGGETGYYYLVDADPLDAVIEDDSEPVYLGAASILWAADDERYEPLTGAPFRMYQDRPGADPEAEPQELDNWVLIGPEEGWADAPGFEAEAENADDPDEEPGPYDGFDNFRLTTHNLDVDADGTVYAGHYHAGARFYEIVAPGDPLPDGPGVEDVDGEAGDEAREWHLLETAYYRRGTEIPEEAALIGDGDLGEGLTASTPFFWSLVQRNGVAFASGINAGPHAIVHDDARIGDDTPVDCSVEREADASLFTAGQTSQIRVHVDADEPVRIRDRIPGEWDVVGGDVSVEEISGGDRKVVTFDEAVREGTLRYFVEVPEELADTGAYTAGPVEYARPEPASEYGGGVSANNFLWRKENGETVTKTVVGLET